MVYKMGYWNLGGLGECVRLLLNVLGQDYEDEQIASPDDWFPTKFERGFDFPNLPYLDTGSFKLTESTAILEYLCHKHNSKLLGRNNAEKGTVAMLRNLLVEANTATRTLCFQQDDKAVVIEEQVTQLEKFEKYLGEKTWLIGENFTYIDLLYFEMIEFAEAISEGELESKLPKSFAHAERVRNLKQIKAYRGEGGKYKAEMTYNPPAFAKINATGLH